MSYQKTTICGVVGKTAEVKNFNGKDFIVFSVGVTNGKDAQGNQRPTTWFEVSKDINIQTQGWMVDRLVAKSLVLVDGKVAVTAFIGNDGQTRASLRLYANSIEPLGIPLKDNQSAAAPIMAAQAPNGENIPF